MTATPTSTSLTDPVVRDGLDVTGVSVHYGGVVALDDVTLRVERDQTHGVIGPNGAGKTTLFDVISGIQRPTTGAIWHGGTDLTRKSAVWRARHGLRRTFQRQQVFGGLSVRDNLLVAQEWDARSGGVLLNMCGIRLDKKLAAQRHQRVEDTLELCGLGDVAERYAGLLPIGMARLVELGRAVVDPPAFLLLDEPSSGLGGAEQERLSDTIGRIRHAHGCGVLLVEHDVAFVMEHCDHVSVLALGRKIAAGTPSEIAQHPAVREAYLG